jgi:hypothetical protein
MVNPSGYRLNKSLKEARMIFVGTKKEWKSDEATLRQLSQEEEGCADG